MATEENLALIFIIIGVILLIAEAAAPGFFVAIPAAILIALGVIGLLVKGFLLSLYSPIFAIVVGMAAFGLTVSIYKKIAPPEVPTTITGTSLVGKMGLVTVDVEPHSIRGKVQINNESWSATSEGSIPKGTKVVVVGSEGVHVKIKRMEGGSSG